MEWDESKHPRAEDGKFTDGNGSYRQNTDYQAILENDKRREAVKKYSDTPKEDLAALGLDDRTFLEDEYVGKSVGAKIRNYDIDLNGKIVHLKEGTYITNKEVIAGQGKPSQHIREIGRLLQDYGGNYSKWSKMKGNGIVDIGGEDYNVEIHWYEEPNVGKVEMRVKTRSGKWWI